MASVNCQRSDPSLHPLTYNAWRPHPTRSSQITKNAAGTLSLYLGSTNTVHWWLYWSVMSRVGLYQAFWSTRTSHLHAAHSVAAVTIAMTVEQVGVSGSCPSKYSRREVGCVERQTTW